MVVNRVPRITDWKGGEFQMLHARQDWSDSSESADVIAFPRQTWHQGRFRLPSRFASRSAWSSTCIPKRSVARWFRGVATLAALCGAAFFLAPGFEPFIASKVAATPTAPIRNAQLSDLALPDMAKPVDEEHSEAGRSPHRRA